MIPFISQPPVPLAKKQAIDGSCFAFRQLLFGPIFQFIFVLVAASAERDLANPQVLWVDGENDQSLGIPDHAEGEGSLSAVDDGSASDSTLAYHAVFRSLGDQPDRSDLVSGDTASSADELSLDDELLGILAEDGRDS